jgi:flavin-dependent dehydrogenase
VIGEGVLIIGDAAGLAYTQSGEGIRPAIESGLLAAKVIAAARGEYTLQRLKPYEAQLRARFGERTSDGLAGLLPTGMRAALGRRLMRSRWFARSVVLDRWFLHSAVPALSI